MDLIAKGDYFPVNQKLIIANIIIHNTTVSMSVISSNTNTTNTTAMMGVNDFSFAHKAIDIIQADITSIPKYSLFGMLIVSVLVFKRELQF